MEGRRLAPKVKATYQAVIELLMEGRDLSNLTVAEITARAGIGKGTVYEYFSNKEEMIAGALFYEMENACRNLYGRMKKEKDLYGKINLIFMDIEKQIVKTNCFLRILYILMDNSTVSSRLKQLIETKNQDEMLIMDMVGMLIEEEMGNDRALEDKEKTYLTMLLLSKIICYAMYQFNAKNELNPDSAAMREMLCYSTCREIESFKAKNKRGF